MWITLGIILLLILLAQFAKKWWVGQLPPPHRNSDLVKVVMGLEEKPLNDLFKLYAAEFGPEAARYARRTFNRWKTGEVRPNRQTFNRLLIHLPNVMSFDLKCEVLRRLREEYCARHDYQLTVDTENWRDSLAPLVTDLINKSYAAQLPSYVEGKLRWLAADDMQAARAILAESEARESRNAIAMLEQEFDNIERLMRATGGRVTHTVKLPFGTIRLQIRGRKLNGG